MNFYKDNSNPLERVGIGDLVAGEIYVNDEGIRLMYGVDDDGQPSMDVIQWSELNLGFTMEDLVVGERWYSKKLVNTYWALMRNRRRAQ